MKTSTDPGPVIRRLARDLDVEGTLSDFPGLTREDLRRVLAQAAGPERELFETAVLSVDGGARGNPGPAGAGVVLQVGKKVVRLGEYLGETTNNVAEYKALLLGLKAAADMGVRELEVRSDSELMVRQLNGQYKVRSLSLVDLYFSAIKQLSGFRKSVLTHIPREENKEADRMANMAIDAKGPVSL
ncbi:MAG: ribonuclease HI family protein [bacterium]|nr:ribonuclease HI family protein [bacterium]MDT8395115.1 ribonuclease HI family protein [bacterium]